MGVCKLLELASAWSKWTEPYARRYTYSVIVLLLEASKDQNISETR